MRDKGRVMRVTGKNLEARLRGLWLEEDELEIVRLKKYDKGNYTGASGCCIYTHKRLGGLYFFKTQEEKNKQGKKNKYKTKYMLLFVVDA